MADSATRPPAGREWRHRVVRWWAAGLAFVVGLLVGALLVGLLSGYPAVSPGASGVEEPSVDEPGAAEPDDADTPESAGATGQIAVNASCLRTINAAQDVFEAVQGLGEALTELDAGRLDEIVRQLQPLQRRLQSDLEDCDVDGQITDDEPGTGAASPTGASPAD